MLHQLGLVPSGIAETALLSQFLEGVARLASIAQAYTDSGAADAYVLTRFSSIQSHSAYFDGMEIQFKATNVNTGASTVNVSTLGIKNVTLQDGTALVAGQIPAGEYTVARYNLASDRFEIATPPTAAGVAKAWVKFKGTGVVAINDSFNVSSITDNGTGDYTVNFASALPNADYCVNYDLTLGVSQGAVSFSLENFLDIPSILAASVRVKATLNSASGTLAVDTPVNMVSVFDN
jgi:hypothetical protein